MTFLVPDWWRGLFDYERTMVTVLAAIFLLAYGIPTLVWLVGRALEWKRRGL